MVKVKICGVTNFDDASRAVTLGADYVGFNFYKKSKRNIAVATASGIISKLPPVFSPVGIFVDEQTNDNILKTIKKCSLKLVQLHGNKTPEYCSQLKTTLDPLGVQIIKAFQVKGQETLEQMPAFKDVVDYFLLDSFVEGEQGGTGEVFNWDLALQAKNIGKPIFLAGGLTPLNVADAIEKVEPFAVDVASGVERLPRRKDFEMLKNFIVTVKLG